MAHSRWSEYETQRARDLIAAGTDEREFRRLTGRSKDAAVARIKYVDDPEYRKRCCDNAQRNRTVYEKKVQPSLVPLPPMYAAPPVVVPPSVYEEAQKRYAAPKSLTGWICGDPPRGYSALDQRRAGAEMAT